MHKVPKTVTALYNTRSLEKETCNQRVKDVFLLDSA